MSEVTEQEGAQDTTNAPEAEVKDSQGAAGEVTETVEDKSAATDESTTEGDAPKVPEKYELKLPKDALLDESALERIADYAKQRGLSQEQAQELVEMENGAVTKFRQDQAEYLKRTSEEWKEALLKDKEFGGEGFKKNAEIAKRAVQKFATPDFIKTLEETGLGNHPELVKMFYKIGKAMSDDSFVKPGAQAPAKKDLASVFYGDNS